MGVLILEMEMTDQSLKIRLADDQASLSTTLPKEFVDGLLTKWQAFQSGTATEQVALSRHYTGAWKKE